MNDHMMKYQNETKNKKNWSFVDSFWARFQIKGGLKKY